jgi:hypothetical protein
MRNPSPASPAKLLTRRAYGWQRGEPCMLKRSRAERVVTNRSLRKEHLERTSGGDSFYKITVLLDVQVFFLG